MQASCFEDADWIFEMANARPKYTGLRFNIWIPENENNPKHSYRRIKVELEPKQFYPFLIDELRFSVSVDIKASDFNELKEFVATNKPLILASMYDYLESRDVHDCFAKVGHELSYKFLELVFMKLYGLTSQVNGRMWTVTHTKAELAQQALNKLEISNDVSLVPT